METEQKTEQERVRELVRESYGKVASEEGASPCCAPSCCGTGGTATSDPSADHARKLGYTEEDLSGTAAEGNLGLGCGNPTALAALKPGEVVLDLGAGAGFDALIAGPKVGPGGRVIGVDMTPEMLKRARENAVKAGLADIVEFREGVIEALPVVSDSVDVIISNCVINLSPDKPQVFREAFRVLKPGGRLAVSDIILTKPLPPDITEMAVAYVGCLAGAALEEDYMGAMRAAGFVDIEWTRTDALSILATALDDPGVKAVVDGLDPAIVQSVVGSVWSYKIEARKP